MLAIVIESQQHAPIKIGLTPDFTNLRISVFKSIEDIAKIIKNFDSSLNGLKKFGSTPTVVDIVVMIEAATKKSIKSGKTFFMVYMIVIC